MAERECVRNCHRLVNSHDANENDPNNRANSDPVMRRSDLVNLGKH